MPSERWKWIPGYEGLYQASTWGRIRSVDRWVVSNTGKKDFRRGRILKPQREKKTGYLRVGLCRNGKRRFFWIHRMVAETFIPNPENKPEVNHLDENKTNNAVENLSWCTGKENVNWGTGIERAAASKSKPVLAVDPSTGVVALEFPSGKEAQRNGFSAVAISNCCRGKLKTHRGFEWRFKES